MNYLSIAAIVKDEAESIAEWLSFHHLVGVEKFYIFDNGSTDETAEIVRSLSSFIPIKYIDWPEHPGQISAYQHVIDNFKNETHWCAFIDADEFLYGAEEDDLKKILAGFEDPGISALAVRWLVFGSSHLERIPDGLCIENFLLRADDDHSRNKVPKSVVVLSDAIRPRHPHLFETVNGTVDECRRPLDLEAPPEVSHDIIRLNHYLCKSREQWAQKQRRGRADLKRNHPKFRRSDSDFDAHDLNDVRDETILRFAPAVREFLERESNAGRFKKCVARLRRLLG